MVDLRCAFCVSEGERAGTVNRQPTCSLCFDAFLADALVPSNFPTCQHCGNYHHEQWRCLPSENARLRDLIRRSREQIIADNCWQRSVVDERCSPRCPACDWDFDVMQRTEVERPELLRELEEALGLREAREVDGE